VMSCLLTPGCTLGASISELLFACTNHAPGRVPSGDAQQPVERGEYGRMEDAANLRVRLILPRDEATAASTASESETWECELKDEECCSSTAVGCDSNVCSCCFLTSTRVHTPPLCSASAHLD
jgi:hypothetical protein